VTHHEMLPIRRFLQTMDVVRREGEYLGYSCGRVFGQPVDSQWVRDLETALELAERLEAFVSRFGRMQDSYPGWSDVENPNWPPCVQYVHSG
jgi:hypothetical protein